MTRDASNRTVVIGAGIIGAATALALLDDGHAVTILEPGEPGGPQAASYGNGAWFSPGSIIPMSMPGLWRKVPGFLLDPLGPLTIRWRDLPHLTPWLMRFLWAGRSEAAVTATAARLTPLLRGTGARHAALAATAGVGDLVRQDGLLSIFPDRAAFEAEALAWRLRRENGIVLREIEAEELARIEPDLDRRYGFAVEIVEGAHCHDPGGYVAGLVGHALARGAELVRGRATGFAIEQGRLSAVLTETGPLSCRRAVIAAGIRSAQLARAAGDRVSLASERGYHVVVPDPGGAPRRPVMPSDGKMANTMVRNGLRGSGQVELGRVEAEPNWARAGVLLAHLKSAFPRIDQSLRLEQLPHWLGYRPSTPDGLPVIGRASASADIVHAFGHGHVGMAAAPATAAAVADIFAGRPSELPLEAYSAQRFAGWLPV